MTSLRTVSAIWGVSLGANMAIGVMLLIASVGILKLRRWARAFGTGVAGLMILRFIIGWQGLRMIRAGLAQAADPGIVLAAFVADFIYPMLLLLILNSASARREFADAGNQFLSP